MRKPITLKFFDKLDQMAYSVREFLNFAKRNKRILKEDLEIDYIISIVEKFKKDFIDLY